MGPGTKFRALRDAVRTITMRHCDATRIRFLTIASLYSGRYPAIPHVFVPSSPLVTSSALKRTRPFPSFADFSRPPSVWSCSSANSRSAFSGASTVPSIV